MGAANSMKLISVLMAISSFAHYLVLIELNFVVILLSMVYNKNKLHNVASSNC